MNRRRPLLLLTLPVAWGLVLAVCLLPLAARAGSNYGGRLLVSHLLSGEVTILPTHTFALSLNVRTAP